LCYHLAIALLAGYQKWCKLSQIKFIRINLAMCKQFDYHLVMPPVTCYPKGCATIYFSGYIRSDVLVAKKVTYCAKMTMATCYPKGCSALVIGFIGINFNRIAIARLSQFS